MTNYDRGREDGLYAGLLTGVILGCVALAIVVVFIVLSGREDAAWERRPVVGHYDVQVQPPIVVPPPGAPDIHIDQPDVHIDSTPPRVIEREKQTVVPVPQVHEQAPVIAPQPDTREPVDDGTELAKP